jgi:hypothetical protein
MKKVIYSLLVVAMASASCKKTASPANESPVNTSNESVNAAKRAATTVQFSGYTWNIRNTGSSTEGPGPNIFSGSNAWVDSNGWLHLKISKNTSTNKWNCAEISSTQNFGYGTYQWQVEGAIGSLDKNIVLGLFNYSGNDGYDEMDIEFARWGNSSWPNLNYTVWPATNSGKSEWDYTKNFTLTGGTYTTHRFTRNSSSVVFKSLNGFYNDDTNLFASATCSSPTWSISTLGMPVHMNLWLFDGLAPSDSKEVEIIIHNFKYTAG